MNYATGTPDMGGGYGHQQSAKGLGFYADVGVMFGSFTADVSTNLVGQNGITQADVDAQKQTMNDSLGSLKVLPSVSLVLVYRYCHSPSLKIHAATWLRCSFCVLFSYSPSHLCPPATHVWLG